MATYNFAASLFCTASRTSLDGHSRCCFRDLVSNGPEQFRHLTTTTANVLGWRDQDGSQDKQICCCMVACIKLQKYAIGNEMSHNNQKTQIFPNTKRDRLGETAGYLQLHCFLTAQSSNALLLRVARLPWFLKQSNLPLHGGRRRTWKRCCWRWNVTSNFRKAELPKHNAKLDCSRKTGGDLKLCSFTFLHCTISI